MIVLYILLIFLLLFLLWILCFSSASKSKERNLFEGKLYAHRGFYNRELGIEENSLPAFQRALEKGYGMEFDLHLTKDEKLLVMHDSSLLRTCNVDLKIPEHNLEELRSHPLNDGTVIPTFEEVLSLVKGERPLIIELKNDGNNGKKLVWETLKALRDYQGLYCIESFDPRIVRQVKKQAPTVFRGQLSCNFFKGKFPFWYKPCLTSMLTNVITRPNFIAYIENEKNSFIMKTIRRRKTPIFLWTVHTEEQAKKLLSEGYTPIFEEI